MKWYRYNYVVVKEDVDATVSMTTRMINFTSLQGPLLWWCSPFLIVSSKICTQSHVESIVANAGHCQWCKVHFVLPTVDFHQSRYRILAKNHLGTMQQFPSNAQQIQCLFAIIAHYASRDIMSNATPFKIVPLGYCPYCLFKSTMLDITPVHGTTVLSFWVVVKKKCHPSN